MKPRIRSTFTSPEGRTFTLGPVVRTPRRFKGDSIWSDMWPILMGDKQVGKLWRSGSYGPELPWNVTTREIVWDGATPPAPLCFDGSPFATADKAQEEFALQVDRILAWRKGRPLTAGTP